MYVPIYNFSGIHAKLELLAFQIWAWRSMHRRRGRNVAWSAMCPARLHVVHDMHMIIFRSSAGQLSPRAAYACTCDPWRRNFRIPTSCYTYIYVYTYIHIYMYTYIYILYIYIHIYIYMCILYMYIYNYIIHTCPDPESELLACKFVL